MDPFYLFPNKVVNFLISVLLISYIQCVFLFDAVTHKGVVKFNGHEVYNLNELEYINGEVWANVWQVNLFVIYA